MDLTRLPQAGDPDNILQERLSPEDLPRYKIARNEKQFDMLLSLLEFHKEVSQRALEVIKMLVTNPVLSSKVLSLDLRESSGEFNWCDIFDSGKAHKMLYSLGIVEAVLARDQNE